jgi:hypothetical protein
LCSCYLRDFLAPNPNSALLKDYQSEKNKLINAIEVRRGRPGRMTKSEEVEMEARLKKWTYEKAFETFYNGKNERNPFNPSIADVMFWM